MARARTSTGGDRLLTMFRENVRRTRARGLSNIHIEDTTLKPGRITVRGRSVHNFGDCSYLGLGMDPRLQAAAKDAIDRYGTSYSSSIAYTAVPLYRDLKERMQQIMGASVALAPTTTLAHASALPVLIRAGDVVLMDSAVHNSVQMATQLLTAAGIAVSPVPHGDLFEVERLIAEAGSGPGRTWYLADGVYSMSGATAPFEDLRRLLDAHPDLWAYVDDAHGFSWHGLHGRGLAVERMGWHDRLVIAAGLSKSFAAGGGLIATPDPDLIELIEMCGPPLSFGGPIGPASLGAGVAAADIHLSDDLPNLQAEIAERIDCANQAGRDLGLEMASADHTPIFFTDVGRIDTMLEIVDAMLDEGYYLNGAMWPIVPHRHAGIRFTVTNAVAPAVIQSMTERLHHHMDRLDAITRISIDLRSEEPVVDVRPQFG